jgi:hypothetical protein
MRAGIQLYFRSEPKLPLTARICFAEVPSHYQERLQRAYTDAEQQRTPTSIAANDARHLHADVCRRAKRQHCEVIERAVSTF